MTPTETRLVSNLGELQRDDAFGDTGQECDQSLGDLRVAWVDNESRLGESDSSSALMAAFDGQTLRKFFALPARFPLGRGRKPVVAYSLAARWERSVRHGA